MSKTHSKAKIGDLDAINLALARAKSIADLVEYYGRGKHLADLESGTLAAAMDSLKRELRRVQGIVDPA